MSTAGILVLSLGIVAAPTDAAPLLFLAEDEVETPDPLVSDMQEEAHGETQEETHRTREVGEKDRSKEQGDGTSQLTPDLLEAQVTGEEDADKEEAHIETNDRTKAGESSEVETIGKKESASQETADPLLNEL